MADAHAEKPEAAPGKKKKLLPLILALVLAGGGFASTYLGFWSPMGLLGFAPAKAKAEAHAPDAVVPAVTFVDVPRIQLTIPATRPRVLFLTAKIETTAAEKAGVEHLMPRVLDAYNAFLSDIDPSAFDKRGVLEIIRGELVTRTRYVLGETPVKDLLITEFMLQ